MKWERFGNEFDFDAAENDSVWDAITNYMDDDIREACHSEYAPCTRSFFLEMYIAKDLEFENLLATEFDIRR